MKTFLTILSLVGILPSVALAEDKIPPAVQRILEKLPKIKAGDTLGSFLSDARIKAQAKEIDGVGGHKCFFLTWTIEDSGHWLMRTCSRQVPKEGGDLSDRQWPDRRDLGELLSVSIYFRESVAEALDFERHQRQFPYLTGRKIHTQLEAERGGTGQPATRPEPKSEDRDKLQPEAEGRSR